MWRYQHHGRGCMHAGKMDWDQDELTMWRNGQKNRVYSNNSACESPNGGIINCTNTRWGLSSVLLKKVKALQWVRNWVNVHQHCQAVGKRWAQQKSMKNSSCSLQYQDVPDEIQLRCSSDTSLKEEYIQQEARGQQWNSHKDRRMSRKPGLGVKTAKMIFKKTINLQQFLKVSSLYSPLCAMSMKYVHFLTLANTPEYASLCPLSGMMPRHACTVLGLQDCLESSKFGIDLLISSLKLTPNLLDSRMGLFTASCLTASRWGAGWPPAAVYKIIWV